MINSGAMVQIMQESSGNEAAVLQSGIDQLTDSPAYVYILMGLERVFAFTIQLALSLLVLYGIRTRRKAFLVFAILAHAAVDFLPGLSQKLHFNQFLVEGYVLIMAVLALIFIVKSKNLFAKGEAE